MSTTSIPRARANGREIAVTSDAGDKGVIGSLVFFTFASLAVPAEAIEAWWSKQDVLSEAARPKETTPTDAFMLTCSAENVRVWSKLDEDIIKEYEEAIGGKVRTEYVTLPAKDKTNDYILIRRVWVQTMGAEGEKEATPTHPILARLRHDPVADRIEVEAGEEYKGLDIVRQVEKVANKEYQFQKAHVNRAHHVQAFKRLIEDEGGCAFGFGSGCMFVPKTGDERMRMFAQYVDEVARQYSDSSHVTDIRLVPALDNKQMREDVAADVARQVQADYQNLLDKTLEYLRRNDATVLNEAQQKRVESSISTRLSEAERLSEFRKRYETLLERKIELGKVIIEVSEEGLSGRSRAVIREMTKLVEA